MLEGKVCGLLFHCACNSRTNTTGYNLRSHPSYKTKMKLYQNSRKTWWSGGFSRFPTSLTSWRVFACCHIFSYMWKKKKKKADWWQKQSIALYHIKENHRILQVSQTAWANRQNNAKDTVKYKWYSKMININHAYILGSY